MGESIKSSSVRSRSVTVSGEIIAEGTEGSGENTNPRAGANALDWEEPASTGGLHRNCQRRVGQTLCGKWRLDALLGVGGTAGVYVATHRNNGRRVAIKVLHDQFQDHTSSQKQFLREGYVANQIGHPSVVSILDDDIAEDGSLFLVMELLEGESLEAYRVRKGRVLPIDQVLSLSGQLLDVLIKAHEKGIIHRDLKPGNLYIQADGSLKVLDFGLAKLRDLAHKSQGSGPCGTPAYMPPEQARGEREKVDSRSDIWAVGSIMFSLLTGSSVHEGKDPAEMICNAGKRMAPPVKLLAPQLPEVVASVIDRALEFDPADRWPDARTMQFAVRQALCHTQPASLGSGPRSFSKLTSRSRPGIFVVSLTACALVVMVGAMFWRTPSTEMTVSAGRPSAPLHVAPLPPVQQVVALPEPVAPPPEPVIPIAQAVKTVAAPAKVSRHAAPARKAHKNQHTELLLDRPD
jgi:serine/threonine-protein kinase